MRSMLLSMSHNLMRTKNHSRVFSFIFACTNKSQFSRVGNCACGFLHSSSSSSSSIGLISNAHVIRLKWEMRNVWSWNAINCMLVLTMQAKKNTASFVGRYEFLLLFDMANQWQISSVLFVYSFRSLLLFENERKWIEKHPWRFEWNEIES